MMPEARAPVRSLPAGRNGDPVPDDHRAGLGCCRGRGLLRTGDQAIRRRAPQTGQVAVLPSGSGTRKVVQPFVRQ
jgi:hypothetical protein